MSVGLLGTALSGLNAYQQALDTTSNNISNANTAGYSVQNVKLATQKEQFTGSGYLGTGVAVSTISRSYNQFLTSQVRSSTSAYNGANSYFTLATQVDNMIADKTTGLSSSMSTFFKDVNSVANDPTSIPSRQVLLTDANSLAAQFNSISSTMTTMQSQVNSNLTASVQSINGYAQTIAQLNTQIVAASNNGTGQMPNGLLDKRDDLLNQLAQQMDVSVVNQADGSINVYIGQGQSLVMGGSASTLSALAQATDSSHLQVILNGQDISTQISGGELSGNIQFRDQVLDPAKAQLGNLATGLATEFNKQHKLGFDLNGAQGLDFFTLGTPSAQVTGVYKDQTLVVGANFVAPTSAANLGSRYRVDVNSTAPVNTYTLTNLDNNTSVSGLDDITLATEAAADGFSISFSGGSVSTGDTFTVSPSYNIAGTIQVNPLITAANQIAASASAATLPGDNANALALANLQTNKIMYNGTRTFSQIYSQFVGTVGANTNAAKISRSAQNTVLQNATASQQSVSGVNLNEEAAKLIQYQNSYQAAAKTVTVAQALFAAILGAVQ
jgi:flagellar hook-associated protein 1